MSTTQYRFNTRFSLLTARTHVWPVLVNARAWKQWWRGVRAIEVEGTGTNQKITMTVGILYTLTFTMHIQSITDNESIAFTVSGDLVGTGEFILSEKNAITTVNFNWNVSTTKAWMNTTAGVLRPFFIFTHNTVMQYFVHGIAKKYQPKLYRYLTARYNCN